MSICSMAVFIVMNSEPNVEDSTVFCHFKYQRISAHCMKSNTPSGNAMSHDISHGQHQTKHVVVTMHLHGLGMLGGIGSAASG